MSSSPAAEASVQYEHVLVPTDGSAFAAAAVPTARALAERFGAELRTVSVASDAGEVERLREAAIAALGAAGGDPRAVVVTAADPADAITRHATDLGRTLVCLSTHGRGRVTGAALGSVARNVLHRSGQVVVAVGPQADRPGWLPARSWPGPLSVPRVVVCVDGSGESEAVLPVALAWADALAMQLMIVTVVDDAPEPLRPQAPSSRYAPEGDAEGYIGRLVQQHQHDAVIAVDGVVLRDPISAASAISSYLSREPASLVAVSTHARSGAQRLLLGSGAADIVHASTAPCLVVPLRS